MFEIPVFFYSPCIFHILICMHSLFMKCISCILIVSILSKCLCIRFDKISNCYMRLIITTVVSLVQQLSSSVTSADSGYEPRARPPAASWTRCPPPADSANMVTRLSSNIYTHLQARGQQAAGHDVADGLGLALVTASHNTLESGAAHTM